MIIARARSLAKLILYELRQHLGYSPPPLIEQMGEDTQKMHQDRPVLQ